MAWGREAFSHSLSSAAFPAVSPSVTGGAVVTVPLLHPPPDAEKLGAFKSFEPAGP